MKQGKVFSAVLLLVMLALAGFELDRIYLRPLRQLKTVEQELRLSEKRQAYDGLQQEVVVIGNSILKQVQQSGAYQLPAALCAVPGDFAVNLGAWDDVLQESPVKAVVVQLGVNDLLAGMQGDEVLQAYRAFARSQTAQEREVWFTGVLPLEVEWSAYVRPTQIERERQTLMTGLLSEDELWLLPDHQMVQGCAEFPTTTDGVHLTDQAVSCMLQFFEQTLPGLAD